VEQHDLIRRWGLELDDGMFGSALAAFGVIAAHYLWFEEEPYLVWTNPAFTERELVQIIGDSQPDYIVPWRLPPERILQYTPPIMPAKDWAIAWKGALDELRVSPRLTIAELSTEDIFHRLFEADPKVHSAYIETSRREPIDWRWPLRVSHLNPASENSVTQMLKKHTARELTTRVFFGRENLNSDLLIFDGNSRELLRALLDIPGTGRANLIIARGGLQHNGFIQRTRVSAILDESSASGVMFIDPSTSDLKFGTAINDFIKNLSHDEPVDVALASAFAGFRPILFLSSSLVRWKVSSVIDDIRKRLDEFISGSRIFVSQKGINNLGLYELKPGNDLRDPKNLRNALGEIRDKISYKLEIDGATGIAELANAVRNVEEPAETKLQRQQRFLQQKSFVKQNGEYIAEVKAFRRGIPVLVRVRIGPIDSDWNAMPNEFPEATLPKGQAFWWLQVILSEPNHVKQPMRELITLSKDGPSTECEFRFTPGDYKHFDGRITVIHRGRVLQTAAFRAGVIEPEAKPDENSRIGLSEPFAVRTRLGDLNTRRQFDLAFVENHTGDSRPLLTAIAAEHAWISDLTDIKRTSEDINILLSAVANSAEDYKGGLNTEKNRLLLIKLARIGRYLHGYIVETQLNARSNRSEIASREYLQIVTTQSDSMVPFEFIYDYQTPDEDAKLCNDWKKALKRGSCFESCDVQSGKIVCPMGFWSISKVIERHALTPNLIQGGKTAFLQSEPVSTRDELLIGGSAIIASSERVPAPALERVLKSFRTRFKKGLQQAGNWEKWEELIQQLKPKFILALPHSDGEGLDAGLEIGGKFKLTIALKDSHVRWKGDEGYPLVALLGCDTESTRSDYARHVLVFRWRGAAAVIGTIATVLGEHAAAIAEQLIDGLSGRKDSPERLGEVLRHIKRQALLASLPAALCLVAYGDADWKIRFLDA
jgi:hypothetical protein